MKPFSYERATDVPGALRAVAGRANAKFLAGGTNLIDLMKVRVETPAHLVDINHLPLADIEETDAGGLRIGALARNHALAGDLRVRTRYPVLSEALLAGASGQLRNLATTGGNPGATVIGLGWLGQRHRQLRHLQLDRCLRLRDDHLHSDRR